MKFHFLLIIALAATGLGAADAQDVYRTYRNARFGTVVRYPANLVAPRPESENSGGGKFFSPDGQTELTIYARRNALRRSARGEMGRAIADWKADGGRLTYYRNASSWFVLSGYLGEDIFYEKTLLRNGVFHTLIWQYPKIQKKRLDAGVSRSAASFSVGKPFEARAATLPRPQPTLPLPTEPAPRPEPAPQPTSRRRRTAPRGNAAGY